MHQGPWQSKRRARFDDGVRVVLAALVAALMATLRRLSGRRRRKAWGFGLEVLIAAYRGSWSVMPKIGMVRWRDVGEALSPLRTDGLPPEFVRLSEGRNELTGAWLEPPDAGRGVLLYFHGGGFVFGSLRTHGELIGALARAAKLRTLAVAYRLAPEHPAPAALEDAMTAYRYLLSQGVAANAIVLAGDSAGGTLVLNTLLALRDAGELLPAAGVAISPWVDLGCSGASFERNSAFDFVGEEHVRLAAESYLQGANPESPEVSPLFAELAGLPPLLVQAGAAEGLVDQIRELAARGEAAGVALELSVYEDMIHVWHMLRGATPEGQRAIDEVGAFARRHISSSYDPGCVR